MNKLRENVFFLKNRNAPNKNENDCQQHNNIILIQDGGQEKREIIFLFCLFPSPPAAVKVARLSQRHHALVTCDRNRQTHTTKKNLFFCLFIPRARYRCLVLGRGQGDLIVINATNIKKNGTQQPKWRPLRVQWSAIYEPSVCVI